MNFKKMLGVCGFTLVEVMIAAGLMGGLGLVMMRVSDMMNVQSANFDSKFAEQGLMQQIELVLLNSYGCANTVGDHCSTRSYLTQATCEAAGKTWQNGLTLQSSTATSMTSIYDYTGRALFTAPQSFGSEITINSFQLVNHTSAEGGVPSAGGEGIVDIVVNMTYSKKILNNKTVTKKVPVKANVSGALPNNVVSCESSAPSSPPSAMSTSCVWSKKTFSNSSWAIIKCANDKRVISAGCACGGTNCPSAGITYSAPVDYEPNDSANMSCSNTAACNAADRSNCSGTGCSSWDCRFGASVGEIYIYTLCCD